MCTIVLVRAPSPGISFLVAANRDELRGRPSSPPRVWDDGAFVAPRDEVHGGSWLGLSSRGLFVGVTNRAGAPRDPARRSRGELVLLALRAGGLDAARDAALAEGAGAFSPYHLVLAQGDRVALIGCDGARLFEPALGDEPLVVTEQSLRGEPPARERLVRERLAERSRDEVTGRAGALEVARWTALLSLHEPQPFAGTCVHFDFDEGGQRVSYGTRSSMVLAVRDPLRGSELHWVEGPPCTTEPRERWTWLTGLRA